MLGIEDRLTRGFWAGVIAGIPTIIINWASHLFFNTLLFLHFDSIVIYGRPPASLMERAFSLFDTIMFVGFLGMIFAYLVPVISSKNLLFKSWFFSKKVWFFIYAIAVAFDLPTISTVTFGTAFSNFIGASVWGVSLGYAFRWLDDLAGNEKSEFVQGPLGRLNPVPSPARKTVLRRSRRNKS